MAWAKFTLTRLLFHVALKKSTFLLYSQSFGKSHPFRLWWKPYCSRRKENRMHKNMETVVKYSTLAKWRAHYLTSWDAALVGQLILWAPPLKIMLMSLFTSSSRIVDLFVCIIKAPNCPISKASNCLSGSIFNAGELRLTTPRTLWTTNNMEYLLQGNTFSPQVSCVKHDFPYQNCVLKTLGLFHIADSKRVSFGMEVKNSSIRLISLFYKH